MTRAVLYARVSTDDQHPENQLQELRRYAIACDWTITDEYIDRQTGATMQRPELMRMTAAADRREFDVLLFWRLDRLTRTGALDTLQLLHRLTSQGIQFASLQEPHLRSLGPFGPAIIAIMATLAEMEREAIRTRTLAGLARARQEGKQLGRPRRIVSLTRIHTLRVAGYTHEQIARKLQISRATLNRRLRELREQTKVSKEAEAPERFATASGRG